VAPPAFGLVAPDANVAWAAPPTRTLLGAVGALAPSGAIDFDREMKLKRETPIPSTFVERRFRQRERTVQPLHLLPPNS
jgi:hypothetical protein